MWYVTRKDSKGTTEIATDLTAPEAIKFLDGKKEELGLSNIVKDYRRGFVATELNEPVTYLFQLEAFRKEEERERGL